MNVERLHVIASTLVEDIQQSGVVNALADVAQALTQLAQQPGQPPYQEAVSSALERLADATRAMRVDDWPAAWRETLEELGAADLVGSVLLEQVEAAIRANEITAQTAANRTQELRADVEALLANLQTLLTAFNHFNIATEDDLAFGEAEVMVTIPRRAVNNRFDDLADEFEELDKILGVFVEIETGSRESMKVRAIASSDFGVFLETTLQVGDFVAQALERLLYAYAAIMTIRAARQQLAEANAGDQALEAVEAAANERMDREIREYIDSAVAERVEQSSASGGREHELLTEMAYSLRRIANRIDDGYNFDVRTPSPPADGDDDDVQVDPADIAAAQRIIALGDRLKYVNRTGEKILSLPEGPGDEQADTGSAN